MNYPTLDMRYPLAKQDQQKRAALVYDRIPRVAEIDDELNRFAVTLMASFLKNGGDSEKAVARLRARQEELLQEKQALLTAHGFAADETDLRYFCAKCKDTGMVDGRLCECVQTQSVQRAYQSSGLSQQLQKENFETFDLSLFSDEPFMNEQMSPRANIAQIKEDLLASLARFDANPDQSFMFCGTAGSGKTFLASAVAKYLIDRGKNVLYVSAYDLCRLMEERRFSNDRPSALSFSENDLYDCDMLIIDDLGTEFASALSVAELYNCINKRILLGKSTLISTNLSLSGIAKNYGDRLASRLSNGFIVYRFYGPDVRMEKRRRGMH